MPNYIHGIIEITVGVDFISAQNATRAEMDSAPTPSISEIVQSFKRHTTIEYIKMVKWNIVPPFEKRIWQRNYYEHIIRNEKSYYQIARYIRNNPLKCQEDKYYVQSELACCPTYCIYRYQVNHLQNAANFSNCHFFMGKLKLPEDGMAEKSQVFFLYRAVKKRPGIDYRMLLQ